MLNRMIISNMSSPTLLLYFRRPRSAPSENQRAASRDSGRAAALPRGRSRLASRADPDHKDSRGTSGEKGTLPGGKAHPRARREACTLHDREAHPGARLQALPYQGARLQDHLSPRQEWRPQPWTLGILRVFREKMRRL